MKRLLILFAFLLSLSAVAQQPPVQWSGGRFQKELMPPSDTFAIPNYYKAFPHVSVKNDTLYIWSPTLARYIMYVAPGGGGGGGESFSINNYSVPTNGTSDATSSINAALALSTVPGLVFDQAGKTILIAGLVNVPQGKFIQFKNGCKVKRSGSGKWNGGLIVCDPQTQCFDTTFSFKANTRYVYNLDNSTISASWFGIKSDWIKAGYGFNSPGSYTNNLPLIKAAIEAGRVLQDSASFYTRTNVYIPTVSGSDKMYYIDTTLEVNSLVNLYGDGMQRTILRARQGLKAPAIKIIYPFGGVKGASSYTRLADFTITAEANTRIYDSLSHGVYFTTTFSEIERVEASDFNGDGFYVQGNAPASNVNCSMLYDVQANSNSGSGIYPSGSDANIITIHGGSAQYNGRWGIWDGSFLGITVVGFHTAANGKEMQYNRTAVTWNGTGTGTTGWKHYYCIQDNGPGTAHPTVVEPGVTPGWQNFWEYLSDITTPPYFDCDLPTLDCGQWKKWNNSTQWVTGGGYFMEGANQFGAYVGCYSESGNQHSFTNNGQNLIIGGFLALYGGVQKGVIGFQGNKVTMTYFQALNPTAGNTTGFQVDHTADGSWWGGIANAANSRIGGFYTDSSGITAFVFNKTGNLPLWQAISPGANLAWAGRVNRSAVPLHGYIGYPEGLFFGRNQDATNMRFLGTGTAAPLLGEWSQNDIIINVGSDNTIDFWKCITGGTPGVWIPIYSLNAIVVNTTGTTGAATYSANTLNIPQYQGKLTLTTTGTSGAATLVGNTLNIPQYTGGGGGGGGGTGDSIVTREGIELDTAVISTNPDTLRARNYRIEAWATNIGNIGTGEDNLDLAAIDTRKLLNEGDAIDITMTFTLAANTNGKVIKIYFGATAIYTSPSITTVGGDEICIRGQIMRNAVAGEGITLTMISNNNGVKVINTTATVTLGGFITLKATGTATADNDIIQKVLSADLKLNESIH